MAAEGINISPLASQGARLLFPDDETFWFEISRSFANAEYGGSLFGEVLTTSAEIRPGDFESWYAAYNRTADRVAAEATTQSANGHTVSARDSFLRASSYYFLSEFFLHGNPKDLRIARAYKLCVESYKNACALFEVPITAVEIPYEGTTLPGYWHRPAGPSRPRPTLIIHTGFDGSAEEQHFAGARAAVERGYNVIAFDGPGQYGALHRNGLVFRPDWEKVIAPVVDFVLKQPDVDPKRIVLMGMSLGGMLAPRAAAFERRLSAVVANDGIYDFGEAILGIFPPERRDATLRAIEASSAPELDRMFDAVLHSPASIRWAFQHGMWAMDAPSPRLFVRKALDYNVRHGIAEKISCPTLVCAAEGDLATKGQPEALYEHLTCKRKTLMRFTNAEGAGSHCQVGASRLAFARIFDWLDDTLSA